MRAGNVIAFGVEGYKGKERVVVVAEVRADDLDAVREAIHHRTLEVCGVPPRDVMLVAAGHLAEDVERQAAASKCRELYLAEELELVPAISTSSERAARSIAGDHVVRVDLVVAPTGDAWTRSAAAQNALPSGRVAGSVMP